MTFQIIPRIVTLKVTKNSAKTCVFISKNLQEQTTKKND